MTRRRMLMALAIYASACGGQPVVLAEYLVSVAPGGDETTIRDVYGRYA